MKKILAILLSALMVVSVIPMATVSAEDGTYKYVTLFDADTFDGKMKVNSGTETGDIDAYTVSNTYQSKANIIESTLSGGTKVLSLVRTGIYDAMGINYADSALGELAKDSIGIRFWLAADTATGAATNNLTAGVRLTDADGNKSYYSADGWWGANKLGTITAEGAYHQIIWSELLLDPSASWNEGHNRLNPASNGNSDSARVNLTSEQLATMTAFHIVFEGAGTSGNTYYIDNIEFIMPYTVTLDGKVIGKGPTGTKVTLPESEETIVGYSDGKTLFQPAGVITIDGDVELVTILKELSLADFSIDTTTKTYTGKAITTTVSSENYVEGTDYEVSYENNVNAGTATVKVTGKGNYFCDVTETFEITAKELEEADFTFDTADKTYTGEKIKPSVTSANLAETDYEVTYESNVNVGTATIKVTAAGDNCTGEVSKTFEILPKTITEEDFEINTDSKTYTGKAIETDVTVANELVTADDYEVSYESNENVGIATVKVTGKGNFTGEITKTFTIEQKAIADADFEEIANQTYTGEELTPELTSELVKDTEYTVEYTDNTNAGTATVTVTGTGNYTGTVTLTFTIDPKAITDEDFSDIEDQEYCTFEIEPWIETELVEYEDFEVEYSDNIIPGKATATIEGIGNYTGTVTKEFTITELTLLEDYFYIEEVVQYTGSAIEPEVWSILLTEGVDFEVEYADNTELGTATVTITGIGYCTGTVEVNFEIVERTLVETDFEVDTTDKTYTGEEVKATVAHLATSTDLGLVEGTDYEVAYENNVNVGTATVKVTGKGNYAGEVTYTYAIVAKEITEADFTVDTKDETYTGKAITKTVTTELKDTDYKVIFTDNVNAGTATITIEGIGNYTGTVTKTFKIVKPVVNNNTNNGGNTTITNPGANGGSSAAVVAPKVAKVKKLKAVSKAAKKLVVSWKKVKGANGYKIVYSTSKKFKKAKVVWVKNGKKANRVIKKLTSGKKYFIKVAAYKTYKDANGKTVKAIGKFTKVKKAVKVK